MLGENVIKFLKLDRSKLTVIADRIGPSYEQIIGGAEIDPALTEHLGKRTGIFDAWEGEARVSEMAALVQADLPRIGALSAAL
jgi:hypothetical protein